MNEPTVSWGFKWVYLDDDPEGMLPRLLRDGWEPFAVSQGVVYLRKAFTA